jgi:tetratricopeptide (TPR) repeat protein
MNSILRYRTRLSVLIVLLLPGCFGGKAQPAWSETQLQAETALNRGVRAEQKGDRLDAEQFLLQSLAASSSIEDNPARAMALINLARLYRLQHDLAKAESCIDRALATTGIDARLSGEGAYEKALIELAKGSPATALEWAQKAIAAEQGGELGSRLNLAGRIQLMRGDVKDAEALAVKALSENRSSGQAEEEANSLRILGLVARNGKEYALGMQFLQDALQIDKRIGKSGKIAADLAELGETARAAGDLKGAATYLQRAGEVNLAGGRLRQAAENQEALARVYAAAGDAEGAARAGDTAQKLKSQAASQGLGTPSATISPSSKP